MSDSRVRRYSDLQQIEDYRERFEYLKLSGSVGRPTFGHERYLNQRFYASREWKIVRNQVIARDLGCDLGVLGHEIHDKVLVHHMNPMLPVHIIQSEDTILSPEYLVTVSHGTHNAIHYGDESLLTQPIIERRPGDTVPWR